MLDFFLDPVVVVSALAKSNIITIELVLQACHVSFFYNVEFHVFSQLSDSVLAHLREIINGAGNVTIAPNDVVEEVGRAMFTIFFTEFSLCQKRNAIEIALKEGAQDSDSDEEWDPLRQQLL